MESYIQISKINDFLYCPASLYLHAMYEGFSQDIYHGKAQVAGKINHETIESGIYSTAKRYLLGVPVYSERYNVMGKIDIYDSKTKTLIERKTKVKHVCKGYRFQLYAQYFCLVEMGYKIEKLVIRSLQDNKRYAIPLPTMSDTYEFSNLLQQMRQFNSEQLFNHSCAKCRGSIYNTLTW